jgi:serine protease
MKRRAAAVALVIAGLAFSALPAHAAPIEITPSAPEPAAAPDSQTILVTLDSAGNDPEAAAQAVVSKAADAIDGAEITEVRRVTKTTVAVTLSGGVTTSEADQVAAKVDDQSNVKAANAATVFHPADTNLENSLWNITAAASKYGVAADVAWNSTTGAGVRVGVVDTGITLHPDLNANVIAGYDFVSAPYGPGDGDGWDSDPSDEGDAHNDSDGQSVKSSWHGTHVAGTIAAARDSSGVVGIAPNAKIEPLRVLGANGGSEADVISAIRWAVGDPSVYDPETGTPLVANLNPAQVLNLSLGGESPSCSIALQEAINYAVFTKGVPVVVAAGNFGKQLYTFSPANCANVIRVTATTYSGTWADYSNYGDYWDPATVAAPGGSGYSTPCNSTGGQCGGILSTFNAGPQGPTSPDYAYMWGTSMAAPHVSGVLALLRAMHPEWTVAQLTAAVRGSATPVAKCSSVDCGAGIVNAAKAVAITNFITQLKAPSISGKFKVGKTLKVKSGKWSPKVKVTYRWLRNGRPISKATKSKYKLTKKDKAKWVSVQVTVTGPAGYARQIVVPTAHQVKR